jgi:HSP20 family protein
MHDRIEELIGEFFRDLQPWGYQADQCFHPPMDIFETESQLVVILEIAGLKAEEIRIVFDKGLLLISGQRSESRSLSKTRLHQMEIDYGAFERTLRIPFPLKADEIKANYRDGFLTLTAPKMKEPTSQKVEVKIR